MEFEIYRNAPIIEAALDVRLRTVEDVDFDTLKSIVDPKYPETSREPFQLQVKIEWGDKPHETGQQHLNTPLGYFLRTSDHKQIMQARRDGLTFNRLAPYENWSSFRTEAKRLWEVYRASIKIEQVEALSLSYMNEILVPYGQPIEDYLNAYINLPKGLPQGLASFSLSFQSVIAGDNGLLRVSMGLGPERREAHVTIGLFIQAIKILGVSSLLLNEEEIWSIFEYLREAKSSAFEACITDKVREAIR